MIISGGSRSNWRFFSKHLMKTEENEQVHVTEIRGLAAQDVPEAFREMDFIASGTRTKNFFYHANINPREGETLSPEQWEQAVDTLERNLGLEGQARFVVEHTKNGRTHCHVVWSRIDPETMTAIPDSLNYQKHEITGRELEQQFGLEPVESVLTKDRDGERPERRPENWETFRGHESGVDPDTVKAQITQLWQQADTGKAFAAALDEHGYVLCKGDRRDFCVVDPASDEHSLARRIQGVKAAEIRARLADIDRDSLPTVAEGRALAQDAANHDKSGGPDQASPAEPSRSQPEQPAQGIREMHEHADAVLHTLQDEDRAPCWTQEELDAAWTARGAPRTLSMREQLAAFAAPYIAELHTHGTILMRDGLTWWERATELFGQIRDTAKAWVAEHAKSFVDYLKQDREDRDDGPDLER